MPIRLSRYFQHVSFKRSRDQKLTRSKKQIYRVSPWHRAESGLNLMAETADEYFCFPERPAYEANIHNDEGLPCWPTGSKVLRPSRHSNLEAERHSGLQVPGPSSQMEIGRIYSLSPCITPLIEFLPGHIPTRTHPHVWPMTF